MKNYVGKNRAENLEWLNNVWLKDGPPVCFLQGFSGVGKSDLARDFRELAEKQGRTPAVINELADRATPDVLESLMELSVVLGQQGLPEMEQVLFEQTNPNPAHALEMALRGPVVIIIDEAQRFFRAESGAPLPEMNGILVFLRNRQELAGRLLLLSDRIVEEARWSEWIPKRTLTKLEPDEAIVALDTKLKETGVDVDISVERKREVVRDLDFNPRAIEALVGALRYDSLDEIIESNPGLWAVRDREVSRDFLKALERDLLERTMRHLDEVHQRKLWRLAVHRRSFKREALEKLCANKEEARELRSVLVTRYLLNFYKGALALNPIVREISLSHLRDESAEFKRAHSAAADYHMRHFKAKQIVGGQSKLGESFAELRYHLTQAGREAELPIIGQRFTRHLKREISSFSPVPTDREELDERIGVLTVLLGNSGAKGLEYHLARCLQSRGTATDLKFAVQHSARATGVGAPAASWFLRAELENQVGGLDAAMRTVYEAIHKVSAEDNLCSLFQLGAELLASANRTDEAVTLLKEGIKVVPPDKNVSSLYQSCAEVLAKAGQTDEAVTLLKKGIKVVPPDKDLSSLYQSCAEVLAKAGQTDEAVTLLKKGIKVVPPDKNVFSLYQSCAEVLAGAGRTDEAVTLLKEGIKVIPPDKGLSSLYQMLGEVHCRASHVADAVAALREGLGRVAPQFGGYRLTEGALYLCTAVGDAKTIEEILSGAGGRDISPQQAALGKALLLQMQGDWKGAAEVVSTSRQQFSSSLTLMAVEAFSRLAAGDANSAWMTMTSFPNPQFGAGLPNSWLATFIHLRRGARSDASAALATYLGRLVDESRELNEGFLLRLWDEQEIAPTSYRLCYHYPILPPSLTGLNQTIRRVQFGKPILLPQVGHESVTRVPISALTSAPPDVYVSYAWGEDSSEAGRQREEIVDRLCEAVQRSGRATGRDKDRMRGGDSIERFANDISKAKRIVAVISEKSLQSEFCMAHELFRAFRRCDYQRDEFQEKVIAVVMDDAEPLLKDDLALIALAKTWQRRLERLRSELQSVDPTRKSPALWIFVDMMEDMCPRLPDMLGALKDIVMKRGYIDIMADNFKEVIDRLPALSQK